MVMFLAIKWTILVDDGWDPFYYNIIWQESENLRKMQAHNRS